MPAFDIWLSKVCLYSYTWSLGQWLTRCHFRILVERMMYFQTLTMSMQRRFGKMKFLLLIIHLFHLFHLFQPSQTIKTSWTLRLTWLLSDDRVIISPCHHQYYCSPQQVINAGLGDGSENPLPLIVNLSIWSILIKSKNISSSAYWRKSACAPAK